jgi:peptide/nickel transport system permease protein
MTAISGIAPAVRHRIGRRHSLLRQHCLEFFASGSGRLGLGVLVLAIASALLAPVLVAQNPYDLRQLDIADGGLPPGATGITGHRFLLGSDEQGRDLLAAILFGLRISLGIGAASTLIAGAIGATIGVLVTYAGGKVETVVMRLVDLQLSFPPILVALLLLAIFGRGIDKVIMALVIIQWAYYARTVRAGALVEMRRDYIAAARCLAVPKRRLVFRHLLPNCLPPLIVIATVQVAQAISLEATLSFLGVGVPVIEPSLGMLIANGYQFLLSGKYWISTFPGLALLVVIVAINLAGDRLRDVLNPRLAE